MVSLVSCLNRTERNRHFLIESFLQGLRGYSSAAGPRPGLVLSRLHFQEAGRGQEEKTEEERQERSLETLRID